MESLLNFFKLNNLEWKNKTFVLAVSTGIDSSVLLDKFIKLSKIEKIKIIVCHVNHHRRVESDEEEEYIKNLCKKEGIKCFVKELQFKEDEKNFQAVAHEERFAFFNETVEKEKADYLVLAHHAIDNIETVLIRMMRGSSLAGYSGINPAYKARSGNYEYLIIRPLIKETKDDIKKYQVENNVKYFEDSSNGHDDYFRNRLRHNIIPHLEEEVSDIDKKFLEFSETIRGAARVINNIRDEFIMANVKKDGNIITFSKKKLLSLDDYLILEVLFELLKPLMLSSGVVREIKKIISTKDGSYDSYICSKLRLIIMYDEIKLILNPEEENKEEKIYLELTEIGDYDINDKLKICVRKITNNCVTNLWELCYNKLPISVRTRQDGDKIKLKPGYKKINDLFIDKKIPKMERDNVLLALDGEEVLIAFGVRKSVILKDLAFDEGYKITLVRKEEN